MSLQIVRNNILDIKVDAIVNPTDSSFSGSGGTDKQIQDKAGKQLKEELRKYRHLEITDAVISGAYGLKNTKYIIHTRGPIYVDGNNNESVLLEQTYKNVLNTAFNNNIETIAIPLISAGTYKYPVKQALMIASNTIKDYLINHNIDVFLLVYDKEAFDISNDLFKRVYDQLNTRFKKKTKRNIIPNKKTLCVKENEIDFVSLKECSNISFPNMDDYVPDESFNEYLRRIIKEKDLVEADIYKRSNLTKQAFNKIYNKASSKPKKCNVLALAIGMKLDITETRELVEKAGYSFGRSKVDYVISCFVEEKHYDIYDINSFLLSIDLQPLGSKY